MATGPLPAADGSRYAPYIGELREFFATSSIQFGSPEDIFIVADRLSGSGNFADDLSSLVRSIVLREGGAMPHAQLLQILSLAIAGPEVSVAPQRYRKPLGQLLAFLGEVMRRPWSVPPSESAEVVPFPADTSTRTSEPATPAARVPVAVFEQIRGEQIRVEQIRAEQIRKEQAREPRSESSSRTVSMPDPESADPVAKESLPPVPASSDPASRRHLSPWQRNFLLGTGVILALAALLTQVLHHRPQAEQFSVARAPAQTVAPSPAVDSTLPAQAVTSGQEPVAAAVPVVTETPVLRPHLNTRSKATAANPQPAGSASSSAPAVRPTPLPYSLAPENRVASAAPIVRRPASRGPDASIVGDLPAGQVRTSPGTPYFTVSSGVMAAYLVSAPAPNYPRLARLARIQGEVILQAVVAKDGSVSTVRVLQGNRLLRGAAQQAVRQWRYRPYRLAGKPVDVATIITVDFHDRD